MSRPVVVFLCTGNSARSQVAEALLKHYAGNRFEVHSAGTQPRGLHPTTVQVMEEIGISMQGHRSKPNGDFLGKLPVHYAIIVCEEAEKSCPTVRPFAPGRLFWRFDDPAAFAGSEMDQREQFRQVRDEIDERKQRWLAEEQELEGPVTLT